MASLEALPYFKWMWRDWRSNRRVQRMSWAAKGLYRELLDEQWAEGSIPNDMRELAEICGCPMNVMQEYWPEIEPCFDEREDGRLVNRKMENQRTVKDAGRLKQVASGSLGGKTKLLNTKAKVANAQQSLPIPYQTPYSSSSSSSRAEHKQEQEQSRAPEPPKPPSEHSLIREAVERVFLFYCMTFERDAHQYALTDDRRSKAESRMRERMRAHLGDKSEAERDLADAVFNLAENAFSRENGFIDWTDHIFKSQDVFEKRLSWVKPTGGNSNGNYKGKTGQSLDAAARAIQAFEDRAAAERLRSAETGEAGSTGLPGLRLGSGTIQPGGHRGGAPEIIGETPRRV
jgi:uncharacterized protein YdaU (DUF1376 family)